MIKIEDNVSVVLLSAMLVTFLIFGFIRLATSILYTLIKVPVAEIVKEINS